MEMMTLTKEQRELKAMAPATAQLPELVSGAYAGSAARCDVRAAAGASCARCEKGQG